MIIESKKYAIVTKGFPLLFDDGEGNNVSNFEEAFLGSYENAEAELKCYDEPDKYQILEVKVTYEF